ncbi:hypothetical protein LTR28_009511, partial [Elasticomyces elasticus]
KSLQKLDLSMIEDSLVTQAACCGAQSPLTPPDEQPDAYALAGKRPRSPTITISAEAQMFEIENKGEAQASVGSPNLVVHSRVYTLAEKYDVSSLKLLARWKFEVALACWYDPNEIHDVVEDVYCGTIDSNRELRDVAIGALQCPPTIAYREDIKGLLPNVPRFAEELWRVQSCLPIY